MSSKWEKSLYMYRLSETNPFRENEHSQMFTEWL